MPTDKSLAIIIPAYNEAGRLPKAVSEIRRFLSDRPELPTEIVFVNDGSTDNTAAVITDFARTNPAVRLISYEANRGKGYAVRTGIMGTEADYYLVADADMSTSLFELDKFWPLLQDGIPVVIGTRQGHGAVLIKAQPWHRQKMGEIYAGLGRLATGLDIRDFGCGFKAFAHDAAQKMFAAAVIDRWIWDTEILFLAQKYGYAIREVGVSWTDDRDTRVSVITETFRSLWDLLRIYWRHK